MTAQQQTSIFDFILPKYKVKKPIRLIELFAGYGSQFLSLKYLGAKVDSYKIVEWNANSFKAFNDLHFQDKTDYSENFTIEYLAGFIAENGVTTDDKKSLDYKGALRRGEKWLRETYNNIVATHNLVDITKVKGERLEIIEKDKYEYIMTYSFPCFTADTIVTTQKEGVVVKNTATNAHDLRIRKLTPKECFRLMGVKDDDYDKIAKNQSNSSLYHLAGDSIVVNVLMAIFKQLL